MPMTYTVVDFDGGEAQKRTMFSNQVDLEMLRSDSAKAKIDVTLQRNRYNIDFIVLIPKVSTMGDLIGNRDYLKVHLGNDFINPNNLTVIYTNNGTAQNNHIPMTSWILAHRIGHMTMMPNKVTSSGMWKALHCELTSIFGDDISTDFRFLPDRELDWGLDKPLFLMMSYLLTMRSARMGKISVSADYFAEMLAQHIITGKTTLLRAEKWQERIDALRKVSWPSSKMNSMHTMVLNHAHIIESAMRRTPPDLINVFLERAENVINLELEKFMASCMGKTMVF